MVAADSDTGTFLVSDSFTITVAANTAPVFGSELSDQEVVVFSSLLLLIPSKTDA